LKSLEQNASLANFIRELAYIHEKRKKKGHSGVRSLKIMAINELSFCLFSLVRFRKGPGYFIDFDTG